MKPKYLSFAVFFAAIPIMFFACSDPGGNGPNGPPNNPTGESFQIYSAGSSAKWNKNNGTIRMEIYNETRNRYDYINVGTVKNGGIGTIDNLPDDMSDYLLPLEYVLPVDGLNVSEQGVMVTDEEGLYVISGNDAYYLEAYYEVESKSSVTYESIGYVYASKAVNITGNSYDAEFDIRAKKGWNIIYTSCTYNPSNYESSCKLSTDKKIVKGDIKWYVEYAGPSSHYGGPDEGDPGSSSSGYTSGTWCVDHDNEECTNEPYYLTPQTCSYWNGVLQNNCPPGYYRDNYSPPVACYINYGATYGYDIKFCTSMSINDCENNGGTSLNSCPANSVCSYEGMYIYGEDADLLCDDGGDPDPSGSWCVFHDDEECIETSFIEWYGYTCSDLDGVIMDYCPTGYDY